MADDRLAMSILMTGILCLLGAVLLVTVDYYKRRRSLERLNRMLDAAMDGRCIPRWKTEWQNI